MMKETNKTISPELKEAITELQTAYKISKQIEPLQRKIYSIMRNNHKAISEYIKQCLGCNEKDIFFAGHRSGNMRFEKAKIRLSRFTPNRVNIRIIARCVNNDGSLALKSTDVFFDKITKIENDLTLMMMMYMRRVSG